MKFRAVDGEGAQVGGHHNYFLLAAYPKDGLEEPVLMSRAKAQLRWEQCLSYLTQPGFKGTKNVFYSMGYDVNMFFRDLPEDRQRELFQSGETSLVDGGHDYFVRYIPRKILKVSRDRQSFVFYDVWSFFAKSFVKACASWKVGTPEELEFIEHGKTARGTFDSWEDRDVVAYNDKELELLVALMDKLDAQMLANRIELRSYHGPGAIAAFLLDSWGIKEHYPEQGLYDTATRWARRRSVFGGRVELFKRGEYSDLYHYDINSAYPTAMRDCPSLVGRDFDVLARPSENRLQGKFGVVDVRWKLGDGAMGPFPFRTRHNYILFPNYWHSSMGRREARGTYHIVEALAAKKLFPSIELDRAWVLPFEEHGKDKGGYVYPLRARIDALAKERMRLKAVNELLGMPLKLGMNSMYGKIEQKPSQANSQPEFRELFWGGYMTAATRAKLMLAAKPQDLVLFATDGIYSLSELGLDEGPGLGQWEAKRHKKGVFFLAGVYVTEDDGKMVLKTRGYSNKFDWQAVLEFHRRKRSEDEAYVITDQRFLGVRKALTLKDRSRMCSFVDEERKINWDANAKRIFFNDDDSSPNNVLADPAMDARISASGGDCWSFPYLDVNCVGYAELRERMLSVSSVEQMEAAGDVDGLENA